MNFFIIKNKSDYSLKLKLKGQNGTELIKAGLSADNKSISSLQTVNWNPSKSTDGIIYLKGSPHLEFYIILFSDKILKSTEIVE